MSTYKYLILLSLVFLAACGTVNVATNTRSGISRGASITVAIGGGTDPIGAQGTIEHLLLERGFNVISEATAHQMLQANTVTTTSTKENVIVSKTEHKSYDVTDMGAHYFLKFHYTYYWDVFYYSLRSFNATVVNSQTGEIVASANFRGDKSAKAVFEEFINSLASNIR